MECRLAYEITLMTAGLKMHPELMDNSVAQIKKAATHRSTLEVGELDKKRAVLSPRPGDEIIAGKSVMTSLL